MEWININAATLRAPEYIGSEPISRATWLNVLAYCAQQENGGRIVGAAKWKDRQWQQTCGVMLDEVREAGALLSIEGEDVIVWRYPLEKEAEVQAKRRGGSAGGKAKAEHAAKQKDCTPATTPSSTATPSANSISPSCAPTEGKGREGKEKEGNGAPAASEAVAFVPMGWFPEALRKSPAFVAKWGEWEEHLRQAGKALTSAARRAQLSDCDRYGEFKAVETINLAFSNGWKSLVWDFQKKDYGHSSKAPAANSRATNQIQRPPGDAAPAGIRGGRGNEAVERLRREGCDPNANEGHGGEVHR